MSEDTRKECKPAQAMPPREAEVLIENWRQHDNAMGGRAGLAAGGSAPHVDLAASRGLPCAPVNHGLADHCRTWTCHPPGQANEYNILLSGGPGWPAQVVRHSRQDRVLHVFGGRAITDDIGPPMRRIRPLSTAPLQAPLHDNQQSTADPHAIFVALLINLKLILAIPMIAGPVAYRILHFAQPQYKSTTENPAIYVKRANDPASDMHLSIVDFDQAGGTSEIAVIAPQSLASRVVGQLTVDTDPEFLHGPLEVFVENTDLAVHSKSGPTTNILAITEASTGTLRTQRIAIPTLLVHRWRRRSAATDVSTKPLARSAKVAAEIDGRFRQL